MKQRFLDNLKHNWWKYLIVVLVLAVDMLTKFLIVPLDANNNVDFGRTSERSLIGDLVWISPQVNSGAGFSILEGKTILLIVMSFLFIVGFIVFDLVFSNRSKLYNISFGLIFAGAIGNLVDRLAFGGKVRDFIYLKFINFAVFNVADMALTFGIICLLVYIIFFQSKDKTGDKSKDENRSEVQDENNNKTQDENDNQIKDNGNQTIENFQEQSDENIQKENIKETD